MWIFAAAGDMFGGGVVRVEGTNCSHLGAAGVRYPGELVNPEGDGCCSPAAVRMLRASGHSGRQWSPMAFACPLGNHPETFGSNTSILGAGAAGAAGAAGFAPYTVPARELRRLLVDARERHPTVRARPRRLSALSVSHSENDFFLYGAFVRACRALNSSKWWFPPPLNRRGRARTVGWRSRASTSRRRSSRAGTV
jgi:hypothetical protein